MKKAFFRSIAVSTYLSFPFILFGNAMNDDGCGIESFPIQYNAKGPLMVVAAALRLPHYHIMGKHQINVIMYSNLFTKSKEGGWLCQVNCNYYNHLQPSKAQLID